MPKEKIEDKIRIYAFISFPNGYGDGTYDYEFEMIEPAFALPGSPSLVSFSVGGAPTIRLSRQIYQRVIEVGYEVIFPKRRYGPRGIPREIRKRYREGGIKIKPVPAEDIEDIVNKNI